MPVRGSRRTRRRASRSWTERAASCWDRSAFATSTAGSGEVGYWVKREARGRGVATRALELVARWALVEKGLGRFQLRADVANGPSQRVAEKAGFVREGVLRSALAFKGERRDVVMYSLVPDDL